jgi:protein-tyrosine-phosphatase
MSIPNDLRSARHAALGDPVRLAIVDQLTVSDCSPVELRSAFGLPSNLLAHHLDVLEQVGLIYRSTSSGDARRRYIHLNSEALGGLAPTKCVAIGPALFLCTRNSARSQLAAALWEELSGCAADSAGTKPAEEIDRRAVTAAKRRGLQLVASAPKGLGQINMSPTLVITVCDLVHEELVHEELADDELTDQVQSLRTGSWLHWSVPDPVKLGTVRAFDSTLDELTRRVSALVESGGSAA